MQKWSRELILDKIHQFVEENSRVPGKRDFGGGIYPSESTVRKYFGSWNNAIQEAGLVQNKRSFINKKELLNSLHDYYLSTGKIPSMKEFNSKGCYPHAQTLVSHFGSWSNALETAGFKIYVGPFGVPTKGKDGVIYKSRFESYFVDTFLYQKYHYKYEPSYPHNSWKYDFLLVKENIFIELVGGLNKDRVNEKIEFNSNHNINCIYLTPGRIYSKDFNLEEYLCQTL